MEIMDGALEEQPGQAGKHRIAHETIQPGHGPLFNPPTAAGEPAAHHQVETLLQPLNDRGNLSKIIAAIRVAHDDPHAQGSFNAASQRRAIPSFIDGDHARAGPAGHCRRGIRTAVVRNHDFPQKAGPGYRRPGPLDAFAQSTFLVQARQNDADIQRMDSRSSTLLFCGTSLHDSL